MKHGTLNRSIFQIDARSTDLERGKPQASRWSAVAKAVWDFWQSVTELSEHITGPIGCVRAATSQVNCTRPAGLSTWPDCSIIARGCKTWLSYNTEKSKNAIPAQIRNAAQNRLLPCPERRILFTSCFGVWINGTPSLMTYLRSGDQWHLYSAPATVFRDCVSLISIV